MGLRSWGENILYLDNSNDLVSIAKLTDILEDDLEETKISIINATLERFETNQARREKDFWQSLRRLSIVKKEARKLRKKTKT